MEFFKQSNIDFLALRKWAAIFSVLLFIASLGSLLVNGLNLGMDFTGGTQIQVSYAKPANVAAMRDVLKKSKFPEAELQLFGTPNDVLIRQGPHKELNPQQLKDEVMRVLPSATIQSVEFIGPQVGKELALNGILAIVVALLGTMIYIAWRFEYRLASSAAVALIHDPVLILGIFSFYHIPFDLKVLAALLTVIGYSLNDTIVVFDRVRENFRKMRKGTPVEIVNASVNQTLSRTIMTSSLTLVVVIALFLYGGPVVHSFSLALMIGIFIGTYSSIYVAGALAVSMGLNKQDLMPVAEKEVDVSP